jgi:hypothetical protein
MGKNIHDLRFFVRSDDGFGSAPWRLWITSLGDVYVAALGMGGIHKYSFHVSGICRSAFTKEYADSHSIDRAAHKWKRMSTPDAGSGIASRVAWIAFPTDYLSCMSSRPQKRSIEISSAPRGGAAYIELAYTRVSKEQVLFAFSTNGRVLHSYVELPFGESFFMASYHTTWENCDLTSLAGPGSVFPDLLFSTDDPRNTGRRIRMVYGPRPKDGDAILLTELGGYEKT